jgi:hypothetical protein
MRIFCHVYERLKCHRKLRKSLYISPIENTIQNLLTEERKTVILMYMKPEFQTEVIKLRGL